MYFTYFGQSSKPGNRLQSCARDLLEAESNKLIDHPTPFVEQLQQRIETLNVQNPRCKPLKLRADFWDPDAIGISLDWFTVSFHLYRVKTNESAIGRAA
jgi:hypothetical protein